MHRRKTNCNIKLIFYCLNPLSTSFTGILMFLMQSISIVMKIFLIHKFYFYLDFMVAIAFPFLKS